MCIRDSIGELTLIVVAHELGLSVEVFDDLGVQLVQLGAVGVEVTGLSPVSYTHLDVYKRQYYYYKCGNAKRHGKAHCDLKAIRKEPLERFVVDTAIKDVYKRQNGEYVGWSPNRVTPLNMGL